MYSVTRWCSSLTTLRLPLLTIKILKFMRQSENAKFGTWEGSRRDHILNLDTMSSIPLALAIIYAKIVEVIDRKISFKKSRNKTTIKIIPKSWHIIQLSLCCSNKGNSCVCSRHDVPSTSITSWVKSNRSARYLGCFRWESWPGVTIVFFLSTLSIVT